MDLDVTSEFLLIASTLIQLKVRRLLPNDLDVDLDEEFELMEERDRLLHRLLMCVTFKDVAAVMAARMQAAHRFVPRISGLDHEIRTPPPEVVIPVDATGLRDIADRVLIRSDAEPELDHLDLELPSVQSAIEELRVRMADTAETTFETLVDHCTRRVEIAAYFLALLELARWGMVEIAQEDWLSSITVRPQPGAPDRGLTSEW